MLRSFFGNKNNKKEWGNTVVGCIKVYEDEIRKIVGHGNGQCM